MALVEWKDDFETGIPSADYEHRKLIELINELHEGLGDRPERQAVVSVLEEIMVRFSSHFRIEEDAMRERKYDEYHGHREAHERLLGEVRGVADAVAAGGDIPDGLRGRLESWFLAHFRGPDARLHKFLDRAG